MIRAWIIIIFSCLSCIPAWSAMGSGGKFFKNMGFFGVTIEPYIMRSVQGRFLANADFKNTMADSTTVSGETVGGRVGYLLKYFFIGYDFSRGNLDSEISTGSKKFITHHGGIYADILTPIRTHIFIEKLVYVKDTLQNVTLDPDGAGGSPAIAADANLGGDGYKIGLEYFLIFPIVINISYTEVKYDTVNHSVYTSKQDGNGLKFTDLEVGVGTALAF